MVRIKGMALKAENVQVGDTVRLLFMGGTEDVEVTEVVDRGEHIGIVMSSFVVPPIYDLIPKYQELRVMNR